MKRRTFLTGAFVGTAALALGISFYNDENFILQEDEYHSVLFSALIPVFLDGALPEVPSQRQIVIESTLASIRGSMQLLPDDQYQELQDLLVKLESRFGLLLLTGSMTPLLMRSPQQLTEMLEDWRHHYLTLIQTAYTGLRELILTSFYGNPDN